MEREGRRHKLERKGENGSIERDDEEEMEGWSTERAAGARDSQKKRGSERERKCHKLSVPVCWSMLLSRRLHCSCNYSSQNAPQHLATCRSPCWDPQVGLLEGGSEDGRNDGSGVCDSGPEGMMGSWGRGQCVNLLTESSVTSGTVCESQWDLSVVSAGSQRQKGPGGQVLRAP